MILYGEKQKKGWEKYWAQKGKPYIERLLS